MIDLLLLREALVAATGGGILYAVARAGRHLRSESSPERDSRRAFVLSTRSARKLRAKDYDGALSDASKAIALDPELGWGYVNRGAALVEKGRYEESLRDSRKAIELLPGRYQPYLNAAQANKRIGNIDEALKAVVVAVRLEDSENIHKVHAEVLWGAQLYQEAEMAYERARSHSPENPAYPYMMGLCRYNLSDYEGAIDYCNDGSIHRSSYLRYLRGLAKFQLSDLKGARSDFDRAMQLEFRPLEHLVLRVHCHLALGDTEGAMRHLSELGDAPYDQDDRLKIWHLRYKISLETRDFASAMAEARKIQAAHDSTGCWSLVASAACGLKDWNEAVSAYTRALEAGDSAGLLGNRAWVYLQAGNLDKAQEDCTTALTLNSHLIFARSVQLELYVAQGNLRAAVASGCTLEMVDPHYMRTHEWLAIAYDRLNETDLAVRHYEQFLLCKPRYDEIEPDLNERRIKAKTRLSELHESRQNL